MSGMRGWKIRRNALCASGISYHQNQSPAIMLAKTKKERGGDAEWREGEGGKGERGGQK